MIITAESELEYQRILKVLNEAEELDFVFNVRREW
jgi:hypothetical protein